MLLLSHALCTRNITCNMNQTKPNRTKAQLILSRRHHIDFILRNPMKLQFQEWFRAQSTQIYYISLRLHHMHVTTKFYINVRLWFSNQDWVSLLFQMEFFPFIFHSFSKRTRMVSCRADGQNSIPYAMDESISINPSCFNCSQHNVNSLYDFKIIYDCGWCFNYRSMDFLHSHHQSYFAFIESSD